MDGAGGHENLRAGAKADTGRRDNRGGRQAGGRRGESGVADGFIDDHLREAVDIIGQIDRQAIARLVDLLSDVRRDGGRLFFIGVGGSAANCSHAVNDFRKIAGIEAYAPTDNVSELTARTNDEGWDSVFVEWLKVSRLAPADAVIVFSVGGGSLEQNVSANLVRALQHARSVGCRIGGVVSRDGGFTAQVADACVIIPTVNAASVTPHAEAFQAVIWHLLVSHPKLKSRETKWESVR
jgi:D-sedoheptulose 7-phosphate isomerase